MRPAVHIDWCAALLQLGLWAAQRAPFHHSLHCASLFSSWAALQAAHTDHARSQAMAAMWRACIKHSSIPSPSPLSVQTPPSTRHGPLAGHRLQLQAWMRAPLLHPPCPMQPHPQPHRLASPTRHLVPHPLPPQLPSYQPIPSEQPVITLQDGQFCPTSQPAWSAYREPTFGHGKHLCIPSFLTPDFLHHVMVNVHIDRRRHPCMAYPRTDACLMPRHAQSHSP